MTRTARHLILLFLFLLPGAHTLAAEDMQEEQPATSMDQTEEPVLSEEDQEVLAHMELLALMDLLKDMDLLESLEDKR